MLLDFYAQIFFKEQESKSLICTNELESVNNVSLLSLVFHWGISISFSSIFDILTVMKEMFAREKKKQMVASNTGTSQ